MFADVAYLLHKRGELSCASTGLFYPEMLANYGE